MNIKTAHKIVDKIIFDLNDRKGFDIHTLDEDIQEEIRQTWVDIILLESREENKQ